MRIPIMLGLALLALNAQGADCTSRANIFGGTDMRCSDGTRLQGRANIFGGQDWSDGWRSRANIFGGQDYQRPGQAPPVTVPPGVAPAQAGSGARRSPGIPGSGPR